MSIIVYTDGACGTVFDPMELRGLGTCACIVIDEKKNTMWEFARLEENTTNNRMELEAIRVALDYCELHHKNEYIHLFSDSEYAIKGLCLWSRKWRRNGFKKGTIKNKDIWMNLISVADHFGDKLIMSHVKGHSGITGNEYVDQLCEKLLKGELNENLISNKKEIFDLNFIEFAKTKSSNSYRYGGTSWLK